MTWNPFKLRKENARLALRVKKLEDALRFYAGQYISTAHGDIQVIEDANADGMYFFCGDFGYPKRPIADAYEYGKTARNALKEIES